MMINADSAVRQVQNLRALSQPLPVTGIADDTQFIGVFRLKPITDLTGPFQIGKLFLKAVCYSHLPLPPAAYG